MQTPRIHIEVVTNGYILSDTYSDETLVFKTLDNLVEELYDKLTFDTEIDNDE